jgi:hypothetical protein
MAVNPTTLGTLIGSIDWVHGVLIGSCVLGGILVGIGIIKEAEKWSIAVFLVLVGVILEAIFTIALFVYDESISHEQQSIIRAQNDKIIFLERHLEARSLTPEESAPVAHRIAQAIPADIGPIAFEFAASNDEEIGLAIDLADHVFSRIGWDWVDWPSDMIGAFSINLPIQKRRVGSIPLSGIQVQISDPRLSKLADVIVEALQSVGLENVRMDPALNAEFENANQNPTVAVMIGIRPPLRIPN